MTVGDAGNVADDTGYGVVDYTYLISKYEVTAGQYTEFLNAVAASDPHGLYSDSMTSGFGCQITQSGSDGSYTYSVPSDRENRPVNYVSFFDAMRFVNWLNNGQGAGDTETGVYDIDSGLNETRSATANYWIPGEDEWYKAAYYKGGSTNAGYWDYPMQSDSVPSNDIVDPDPGNNANFYQGGYTIGSPYFMTEVGEFENSVSHYGTYDQGGNVWEWNEAVISSSYRGLRGGSWKNNEGTNLRAVSRSSHSPTLENEIIGIRIAAYFPPPIGDANGDGHVNGSDYLIWAANFGADSAPDPPGPPFNADFNEDTVVNGLDYLIWAGTFGQGPNDTTAVPEPSTVVLLMVGATLAILRCRQSTGLCPSPLAFGAARDSHRC